MKRIRKISLGSLVVVVVGAVITLLGLVAANAALVGLGLAWAAIWGSATAARRRGDRRATGDSRQMAFPDLAANLIHYRTHERNHHA